MKKTFYLFMFLFLTGALYAQKSIQYVSFFPVSVTQNNVTLTQDNKSFSILSGVPGAYNGTTTAYHSLPGGLILGATDNAVIEINNMNIKGDVAINKIQVDSILKIVSKGSIEKLKLGDSCANGNCGDFLFSANNINFAWDNVKSDSALTAYNNVNVSVENLASVRSIYIKGNNGYFEFLPGLGSGDKLAWVSLRLPRTDTCRKYLVKYTGSKPSDNCNLPI